MEKYILSIDQGTTGSTVALIDKKARIVASSNVEFPQIFPKPGYVEHNLDDIWKSIKTACENTLKKSKTDPNNIISIGITNQRETVALWDKQTGNQLHNAIVWQCRRTASICEQLKKDSHEKEFHKKTGLYLDPYFSGTKIKWLLEKVVPKNMAEVCCGTIDTYLCFKLTDGNSFVTEPSNASRTLVYNIVTNEWDKSLLSHLNIPIDILPEVMNSGDDFGKTRGLDFLPDGIPITGILGDQQAALFGQLCFDKGNIKCTYGTGAFLLMNSGEQVSYSNNNLLTTIAWKDQHSTTYALEGSVFIAGAAVQWLRDGLGLIEKASDIELLAKSVDGSDGIHFVPALTGLGAPHWDPHAKGIITGITRGTTKNHIARAALEGIAFQIHDLIRAMEKDLGFKISHLNVDGGASINDILMQFQSDILEASLVRPWFIETTALGAAYISGLHSGFWKSRDELSRVVKEGKVYSNKLPKKEVDTHISGWEKALKQCLV